MQPHTVTRSSLEEMLDHLCRTEDDKTIDLPPALPLRPPSRARLPTTRPFPSRFGVCDDAFANDKINMFLSGEDCKPGSESGGFDSEKVKPVSNGDLEGSFFAVAEIQEHRRLGGIGGLSFTSAPSSCKMECTDDINTFVNKVIHETFTKLQAQVSRMEAVLETKESKNIILQEQLQKLESKLLEYEANTKAKEEMWQNQMESLEMALEASEKNRPPASPSDNTMDYARRDESSLSTLPLPRRRPPPPPPGVQCYEYGSTSTGTVTPVGEALSGRVQDGNDSRSVVGELVKEFEEQKQALEKGTKAVMEMDSGEMSQTVNSSEEELHKLKHKFMVWKKDFKCRLKEAKLRLHKLNHSGDKGLRMLWCRKFPKI